MERSWEAPPLPSPDAERQRAQTPLGRFLLNLGELPPLARYVGHLTLLLLILLVMRNINPSVLQPPPFRLTLGSTAPAPDLATLAASSEMSSALGTLSTAHFLERSAVPLTMRVVRDIVPMTVPQRTARTTVLTYKVQPGDTALGIAEKFGLAGNSLLWANDALNDNPDSLHVDQELYILPVDGSYHIVNTGETVEQIATKYKVDAGVIYGFGGNGVAPGDKLKVGQKLVVPGGTKPYVARQVFTYVGPAPEGARKGSGRFVWPMSGVITTRFWAGHLGVDIGGSTGTPIVAADSGFVAIVQRSGVSYGNMIVIDHGNGLQTLYAHLSAFYVSVGQSVAKGTLIGACGSTGNSTGPHLHFEVLDGAVQGGVRRNPFDYLP
jgi:murein DD-endopeptidase MepM/ murein hydrolase activator NlpD